MAFVQAVEVAPKLGFVNRWETALHERRKMERERQTWLILILCFAGMGISLATLGALFFPTLSEPYYLLIPMVEKLKRLAIWLSVFQEVGQALVDFLPQGLSNLLVGLLVTSFGGLGYSWIVSLQRTTLRKGV